MDSEDIRRQWADRTGEYSPAYYAHYGPNETSEAIGQYLEDTVGRDAAVLEVGCSSGRHLAHLLERGFGTLAGVEVNNEAMVVMEDTYPDLAKQGSFYIDAIEDVVGEFDDGAFDAVYSVETLQHIHPEAEWVFAELARITDLMITVENEGDGDHDSDGELEVTHVNDEFPLYHRDWGRVFTDVGCIEVATLPLGRDTMRAFRTNLE
ncbi:class I SAM-dependent methyltransferase [Halorhabdus amylolytica]|uniref:class I SAM-dependent methyltransferase n=1 Tax=Halorhabdus amylolytica TaxID=2559573 RepID=UPI0010AA39B9|nr:class I SAM-dependent methyltransferase [Halorhabdus amylolytica]